MSIKNRNIDNYDNSGVLKIEGFKKIKKGKYSLKFKYNYSNKEYKSIQVGGKELF